MTGYTYDPICPWCLAPADYCLGGHVTLEDVGARAYREHVRYGEVVFLQGDDAHHALDLIDEDEQAGLDYLLQWDNPDVTVDRDEPPYVTSRDYFGYVQEVDGDPDTVYVMTYSFRLGHVGLAIATFED